MSNDEREVEVPVVAEEQAERRAEEHDSSALERYGVIECETDGMTNIDGSCYSLQISWHLLGLQVTCLFVIVLEKNSQVPLQTLAANFLTAFFRSGDHACGSIFLFLRISKFDLFHVLFLKEDERIQDI